MDRKPPDDEAIRRALIERLLRRLEGRPDTSIIHELGLREGRARVDVVVVTKGRLHGYEIKSDRDDASRLGRQSLIYGAVLDRATLVAGPRAERWATSRIPEWWETMRADETTTGTISLKQVRRGRRNIDADPRALVELLWRDETLALLERHGAAKGIRTKPRAVLWDRTVEALGPAATRAAVVEALHKRNFRQTWGGTRRVDASRRRR